MDGKKTDLIWQKMEQYVKKGEVEYFFWQSLLMIYFISLTKRAQTILEKRPSDLINDRDWEYIICPCLNFCEWDIKVQNISWHTTPNSTCLCSYDVNTKKANNHRGRIVLCAISLSKIVLTIGTETGGWKRWKGWKLLEISPIWSSNKWAGGGMPLLSIKCLRLKFFLDVWCMVDEKFVENCISWWGKVFAIISMQQHCWLSKIIWQTCSESVVLFPMEWYIDQ